MQEARHQQFEKPRTIAPQEPALTILATGDQGLEILSRDNDDGDDNDNTNIDGAKKKRWLPIPLVSGALYLL